MSARSLLMLIQEEFSRQDHQVWEDWEGSASFEPH